MDTSLAKRIGQAARTARAASGKTQQDVADDARVSVEFYARIERGGTLPSVPTLVRLADVLGLSTDVLLGRAEPHPRVGEKARSYTAASRDVARLGRSVAKLSPSHRRLLLRLGRALVDTTARQRRQRPR